MIQIPKPQFPFFLAIVMAVTLVFGASTRIHARAIASDTNTLSGQERVAETDLASERA